MVCPYTECPFNSNDSYSAHRNQPQLTYNEAVDLLDSCLDPRKSTLIHMLFSFIVVLHYNELRRILNHLPNLQTEKEIIEHMIYRRGEKGESIILPNSDLLVSIVQDEDPLLGD